MKKTFYLVNAKMVGGMDVSVYFTNILDAEKACNIFSCEQVAVMVENNLVPVRGKLFHRCDMTDEMIAFAKQFSWNIFVGDGEILPCNQ